jgi:cytochrome c553
MKFLARCLAIAGLVGFTSGSFAQGAASAPPPPGTANPIAQRMQACVMCHGKEGRATNAGYFPRIAGKPAGYLLNQMQNFRAGRRQNAVMTHLMQHMSDDYLQEIANYFARLDLPYPPAQPNRLSAHQRRVAETLVFKGAPDRQIPACVACHGASMAGRLPAMPGLLTLPHDYLVGQLGAWRTGLRHAKAPDCMADISKRLTPEEISSVARWLSAQTLPTGTKPADEGTQPLPLRCGSGEQ